MQYVLKIVASDTFTITFAFSSGEPVTRAKAIFHVDDVTEASIPVEDN